MASTRSPPPASCDADLDCDGSVGAADLLSLLVNWGPCPDPACCPADLDGDGTVGASDQLALLVAWGPCPNCGDCGVECVADLDCDCTVGSVDLNILLLAWGPCDGGSSHHDLDALEQAVQEMGYDDVEDYHEWLAQASEAEALASGWVLYTILQDEE